MYPSKNLQLQIVQLQRQALQLRPPIHRLVRGCFQVLVHGMRRTIVFAAALVIISHHPDHSRRHGTDL